ncbi:MAG: deacetylase [Lachnospiraceae bacterium]|nr:deacetylase [Lachnospiraceae bacterium]
MKKKFIITIDTEGDNLWADRVTRNGPKAITTENAQNLERFQILCEQYGFIPVYLTNYEMSKAQPFTELAQCALKKGRAEIGMHMHAWNSPPIENLPYNHKGGHAYIGEYSRRLQWEKMKYLTKHLEDIFQEPITSHRSGRWWFDEFILKCLKRLGYLVDCTMTPYESWKSSIGNREYGIDYSKDIYRGEYMLSNRNIHASGNSGVYEVPPTILRHYKYDFPILHRTTEWFRPNGNNLEEMLWIKEKVRKNKKVDYLQFMLHSSELTAGTNPTFKYKNSIEKLYSDLKILFDEVSKDFEGIGITRYIKEKHICQK